MEETKIQTLTMEQAIEKGYTHFIEEEGEKAIKFSSLDENDKKYYREFNCYIVDINKPKYFSISDEQLAILITDYVAEQTDVVDEDEKLCEITSTHDYKQLANELNEKFKAHKFYEPIDILVTF